MAWRVVLSLTSILAIGCSGTGSDPMNGETAAHTGSTGSVGDSSGSDSGSDPTGEPDGSSSEGSSDSSGTGDVADRVECDESGAEVGEAGVTVGEGSALPGEEAGALAPGECELLGMDLTDVYDAVTVDCDGTSYLLLASNGQVLLPDQVISVGDTVWVEAEWDDGADSPYAWFLLSDASGALLWGGTTGVPTSLLDRPISLEGGGSMTLTMALTDCGAVAGECGEALSPAALVVETDEGQDVVPAHRVRSVAGQSVHVGTARLPEPGSTELSCEGDDARRLDLVLSR